VTPRFHEAIRRRNRVRPSPAPAANRALSFAPAFTASRLVRSWLRRLSVALGGVALLRDGVASSSLRSPFPLQREVAFGEALIVASKEGRGGALGQVGEFRRLFAISLRSARWVRHLRSPYNSGPASIAPGSGVAGAPNRKAPSHASPAPSLTQIKRFRALKCGDKREFPWLLCAGHCGAGRTRQNNPLNFPAFQDSLGAQVDAAE
jgi:hypothetical protein